MTVFTNMHTSCQLPPLRSVLGEEIDTSPDEFPDDEEDEKSPPRDEPCCQICGVHFNLGRIRRTDEPSSLGTAWERYRLP